MVIFLFIAMVIVGFKVLYPYHFIVAISFLAITFRFILAIFMLGKNKITQTTTYIKFKKYLPRFEKIFLLLFLGVV